MKLYDIIVIGGGLNGLAIASALANNSFQVALIEKKSIAHDLKFKRDGRAISIARYSKQILEKHGIWKHIAIDVGEIHKIMTTDRNSGCNLIFDNALLDSLPLGFLIESDNILKGLYKKIKLQNNITLFEDTECNSITFDPHLATVHTRPLSKLAHDDEMQGGTEHRTGAYSMLSEDSSTVPTQQIASRVEFRKRSTQNSQLQAKVVVIADGKHSKFRSLLKLHSVSKDYDQCAFVFNVEHSKRHNNWAYEHFFSHGPFALLPLKNQHQSSVVWAEPKSVGNLKLPQKELEQFLQERCIETHGRAKIITKISRFPLSLVYMRDYFKNRAVFIGDSLHSMHPLAGQGYNLSLRDIDALTQLFTYHRSLGLDIGSATLFKEFERRRKLDNYSMIAAMHGLNKLFSNDMSILKFARRIGLEVVNSTPILQKFFMNHAMGKNL